MRRTRAFRGFAIAAALAAQPASAQINEADRLERCQNNRNAIAVLEVEEQGWGDERRARLALVSNSLEADQRRLDRLAAMDVGFRTNNRTGSPEIFERYRVEILEPTRALAERMRQSAAAVGIFCFRDDLTCVNGLWQAVERERANAQVDSARRAEVAQQMARYRTNLIALRCDQASAPAAAGAGSPTDAGPLSGVWRSSFRDIRIQISQNGRDLSGQTSDGFSYGGTVDGDSVTLTWTANGGTGSQTGSISYDSNGRAVLIDFGGGISWRRQ